MVGAVLFTIYGALIGATPVAVVNFGIVLIDLYYIWQYYNTKESFAVIRADIDSAIFRYFLKVNRDDIEKQIDIEKIDSNDEAVYTLRDNNIAGVMIGNRVEDDTLNIKLDYVAPRYRDFKVGEFFFVKNIEIFKDRGINRVLAHARDTEHQVYLERVGFKQLGDSLYDYEKVL
jgi:N-acetylglutamate synthase-like GNAT family acetyltransferase